MLLERKISENKIDPTKEKLKEICKISHEKSENHQLEKVSQLTHQRSSLTDILKKSFMVSFSAGVGFDLNVLTVGESLKLGVSAYILRHNIKYQDGKPSWSITSALEANAKLNNFKYGINAPINSKYISEVNLQNEIKKIIDKNADYSPEINTCVKNEIAFTSTKLANKSNSDYLTISASFPPFPVVNTIEIGINKNAFKEISDYIDQKLSTEQKNEIMKNYTKYLFESYDNA